MGLAQRVQWLFAIASWMFSRKLSCSYKLCTVKPPTKSHRLTYGETGFDGLFNDGMGRYRLALSPFVPLYRQAKALHVEPKVHDVAILHHIIFALDA